MADELKGLLQFFKDNKEVIVPIDKDEFIIGRALQTDIRIIQDPKISRQHCRIFKKDNEFYVEDLKSSNGTFVNDEQISSPTKLNEHDKMRVGDKQIIFLIDRRQGLRTQMIDKIMFCTKCGGSITSKEVKEGMAEQRGDGKYICAECAESDTMSAKIFTNYEILGKIAQGGMGVVYKAKHRVINNIVAIKLIREGKETDMEIIKRFMREVKLGSMVRHPNIIEFLDAGEHNGVKYMVMEYCDGQSLEKKFKGGGRIDVTVFPEIAFQIMDAIEAVHKADLVHRDIKPDNILLTSDNVAKLIDFGLVKSLDPASQSILTQSGTIMGSPHYMPPEQVQDSKTPDVRGDIYSLGATFYRVLCGETPVQGRTPIEFIQNLTAKSIIHPSEKNKDIPLDMGTWLMTSLKLSPEDRYQNITEMIRELEQICGYTDEE
jgi:tRNA A-37 threonylcarbamoyl transferase component Bud32